MKRYLLREKDEKGRFIKLAIPLSVEEKKIRNIEYQNRYNKKNSERIKEFKKRWAMDNPEKGKQWTKNNLVKVRLIKKKYKETHPNARIANNLRARIVMALKSRKLVKQIKTVELIGCSVLELKNHLEKQFRYGMTWDNRGLRGWHIDHIKPLVLFDLSDLDTQRKAFHYTNLQPLWAKDNLAKKDKYE